jgi:hypothetical protein
MAQSGYPEDEERNITREPCGCQLVRIAPVGDYGERVIRTNRCPEHPKEAS